MRLIEPYRVPGPMRTCPFVLTSTSSMMPYPCFSPSASANRMLNTAGVSGRNSSGFCNVLGIRELLPNKASVADISATDIIYQQLGVVKPDLLEINETSVTTQVAPNRTDNFNYELSMLRDSDIISL